MLHLLQVPGSLYYHNNEEEEEEEEREVVVEERESGSDCRRGHSPFCSQNHHLKNGDCWCSCHSSKDTTTTNSNDNSNPNQSFKTFRKTSGGNVTTHIQEKQLLSFGATTTTKTEASSNATMNRCDSNTSLHSLSTDGTAEDSLSEVSLSELMVGGGGTAIGRSSPIQIRKSALRHSTSSCSSSYHSLLPKRVRFGTVTVHYHLFALADVIPSLFAVMQGREPPFLTMGNWMQTRDYSSVDAHQEEQALMRRPTTRRASTSSSVLSPHRLNAAVSSSLCSSSDYHYNNNSNAKQLQPQQWRNPPPQPLKKHEREYLLQRSGVSRLDMDAAAWEFHKLSRATQPHSPYYYDKPSPSQQQQQQQSSRHGQRSQCSRRRPSSLSSSSSSTTTRKRFSLI